MRTRKRASAGLTIIEVMVSTVMVGLVLAAATNTVGNVFRARSVTVDLQVGPALARSLLSEILQNPYTDPEDPNSSIGRESGESGGQRDRWDDVDDFDGWDASTPESPAGTPLGYGSGWRRQVSVRFVQPTTLMPSAADTGLKLITVTVTPASGSPTVLQALRSKLGLLERLPSSDRTFVTGSQLALQASSTSIDTVSGTRINNHAIDQ